MVLVCAAHVRAQCPEEAPRVAAAIRTSCPTASAACPNGAVTFDIVAIESGFFPPAEYDPGYSIQPCDTILWDFGDGTTETTIGTPSVTHDFPLPDNYTITATIVNSLGTITLRKDGMAIADSPSRVDFVVGVVTAGLTCPRCVRGPEGQDATITVRRSLDLFRTVTVTANVLGMNVPQTLTFPPGAIEQTYTVRLPDDDIYIGRRFLPLQFSEPRGGTIAAVDSGWIFVVDDEPQPVLSAPSAATVSEGNTSWTPFSIPVHLSAPMGVDVRADVFVTPGSAGWDDVRHLRFRHPAGQTIGAITGFIVGDQDVEPDETLTLFLFPSNTNNDPIFGSVTTVVTIANDDFAQANVAGVPALEPRSMALLTIALAGMALFALRR